MQDWLKKLKDFWRKLNQNQPYSVNPYVLTDEKKKSENNEDVKTGWLDMQEESKDYMLKLVRLEDSRFGTFGVLLIHDSIFCVTLEPPDKDNMQMRSCIPAGIYTCNRVKSPKYGNTFEVADVPNRTSILFHRGNEVNDTKGCILLAEKFGKIRGNNAVLNSGLTFAKFLKIVTNYDEFNMRIIEI